jgi:4-hydroxy-tetrahydrodipicolinate reductase
MKKIKLGITGYSGKMGKAIMSEVKNFPEFNLVAGLLQASSSKELESPVRLTDNIEELCQLSDVILDFSSPKIISELSANAVRHLVPLVCGTTSLSDEEFKTLELVSQKIPILYSQNMSLGITVLASLIREIYLKLADKSDIEILEIHHRNKKDTPSGTSILLASKMLNKKNIEEDIIKRNLFELSTRPKNKIGISAIRGGAVAGQHDVLFMMDNENITISHQALNRNIFASGALRAASFLCNQKPGLYSMQDVLA